MNLKKLLLLFFSYVFIAFVLMTAVYLLPLRPIREHIAESLPLLKSEGNYPVEYSDMPGTKRDNFTDEIMLCMAATDPGKNPVYCAAYNYYHRNYDSSSPFVWLKESLTADSQDSLHSYGRYWNGYLLYLKPLLLIFNYQQIRILNYFFQLALIICAVLGLCRQKKPQYIIPFFCLLTFFPLTVVSKSLQFSCLFDLMVFSVITMLQFHSQLKKRQYYGMFFLFLGMTTSFFDFLTFPTVIPGVALCFYWILTEDPVKRKMTDSVFQAFLWGIGYAGMWASKWILSSLITRDSSILLTAFNKILFRTSASNQGQFIYYHELLARLFAEYPKFLAALCILLIAAEIILLVFFKKWHVSSSNLRRNAPVLLIALLPFLWYFAARNHSSIHYWFAFRNLSVVWLVFSSYLISLFSSGKTVF